MNFLTDILGLVSELSLNCDYRCVHDHRFQILIHHWEAVARSSSKNKKITNLDVQCTDRNYEVLMKREAIERSNF